MAVELCRGHLTELCQCETAPLTHGLAYCVAVRNPDMRGVVGVQDGQLITFDTHSFHILARLSVKTGIVLGPVVSSNGTQLASGGGDNTLRSTTASRSYRSADVRNMEGRWHMSCVWIRRPYGLCVGRRHCTARRRSDVHNKSVIYGQTDANRSRVLPIDYTAYGRLWDVTHAEGTITSSHSAWVQTVRRLVLARSEMRSLLYVDTRMMVPHARKRG